MNEALLTQIITRLLSAPELQALLHGGTAMAEPAGKPGCLVLVTGQADLSELPALTERYRPDYFVAACVAGQVDLTDSRIPAVTWEQAIRQTNWQRLHIPACSREQLARIALGLRGDQTGQLAAWAITRGIPVEIGKIHWDFTEQTPASYRQLFAGYAEQVAGFGVSMPDHENTNDTILLQPAGTTSPVPALQTKQIPSQPPAQTETRYEKRLLGGREAAGLADSQTVRIAKTTVLTPAAIDIFKSRKTEVYREGVRCI
jgi:hypothetical protein